MILNFLKELLKFQIKEYANMQYIDMTATRICKHEKKCLSNLIAQLLLSTKCAMNCN